jgi:hypothetical protein
MPQHQIDVYPSRKDGIPDLHQQPFVAIRLPIETPRDQLEVARTVAISSVSQMLGRVGIEQDLATTYCEAPTAEEMAIEIENAHAFERAGGTLPSTEDILGSA